MIISKSFLKRKAQLKVTKFFKAVKKSMSNHFVASQNSMSFCRNLTKTHQKIAIDYENINSQTSRVNKFDISYFYLPVLGIDL